MNIRSALESLDHMRVTTQVGHDTKLDLGVVGGEEEAIRKILRKKSLIRIRRKKLKCRKYTAIWGAKDFVMIQSVK